MRIAFMRTEVRAAPETAFFKVREIVSQHQRVLGHLFSGRAFICVIGMDWVFSWLRHSYFHLSPPTNEIAWRVQTILFLGYVFAISCFKIRGMSLLSLTPRSKRQSFWERNSDNLGVMLVGAVVGVIGTLVAEWLKHAFWP